MTIERKLISAVMAREVHQVGIKASAADALRVMQQHSVSSILVTEDYMILGIITERDIVRAWHRHGQLVEFNVTDLMQSPVVFVTEDTRCLDAYHLMTSRGIRHVAVKNTQGHVVGMASEGDVMRNFGLEYYMNFKNVGDVMSTEFVKLPPSAPVSEALKAMLNDHQSCVVVVDPYGKPLGMLSERDAVRLCQQPADPHEMSLGAVMHTPVITVKPRRRLHTAVKAMEDKHIRRLVVIDDRGAACGLLTHHEIAQGLEGDYVKYLKDIVELQARSLERNAQVIDEKLLLANILRSATGTAVLASDLDYRISYVTPSVSSVLGLRADEVGGCDIRDTLKLLGWEDAAESLIEAQASDVPRHYVVATDEGSTDFQVSMLFNAKSDPQGYLVMAQRA